MTVSFLKLCVTKRFELVTEESSAVITELLTLLTAPPYDIFEEGVLGSHQTPPTPRHLHHIFWSRGSFFCHFFKDFAVTSFPSYCSIAHPQDIKPLKWVGEMILAWNSRSVYSAHIFTFLSLHWDNVQSPLFQIHWEFITVFPKWSCLPPGKDIGLKSVSYS